LKGLFEFMAAVVLAWILLQATTLLFPIEAVRQVLGDYTEGTLWFLFAVAIAERFTICTFTNPLSEPVETDERQ